MSDDYLSTIQTTGAVAVNGSTTGDIETSGDRDWFAVTLEAGKTYWIDLEGSETEAGTLSDPYLHGVYDANGVFLAGTENDDDDGGAGLNSRVVFTALEAGTYYVAAGAYREHVGTYTLSVTEVPNDLADGTETTGTVAVNGSTTGWIETSGDRDWFAVTLEAGKAYWIDLKGSETGDGNLYDPYLHGVYDENGVLLDGTTNNDGGAGLNSRVFFTAQEAGTYYVAADAVGEFIGTYTLSVANVPDSPVDDFAAGTGTSGTVEVDNSTTGVIDSPGDRDWFAVTLEAGKTYRIDLEGSATTGAGTLSDPYLRGVYDENGVLLDGTTNDNAGTGYNSRVFFTAQADGTYYVAAGAHSFREGTYTLSVTEVHDLADGTGTTGTVAVGGSTMGEIETAGDRDWFAVTLEADKTYRIDLEGSETGDGTLSDPYLWGIHDTDGVLLDGTTNDDNDAGYYNYNSQVLFTAQVAGTYYVAAGAYREHVGTYTLSVTEVPNDLAAGTGTTGTVAVDGSTMGEIETWGDRDWFAVTLEAGSTYRILLEGSETRGGTLSDPYLHGVYDENGILLDGTTNDDGGTGYYNSRVFFTAPATGTYYVAAGAYRFGEGTYTLSVTDVTDSSVDDFTAGTGTSGSVTVDSSTTGVIDYPGDRDWFAVTLEAGKAYSIDLEGSETSAGTLSDPYLRGVHDENGVLLAGTTNDDAGASLNSRVLFTTQEAGTYYVAAGAYREHAGTYTLSVTNVPDGLPDDFTAGTGTSGSVAVDSSTTGVIDYPGDRDWFAVTLEADKTYRIDLEGSRTGDGTLSDPYLRGVHDANGVLLAGTTNDDAGTGYNSRVLFTAQEAGTYYVAAGAYGSREGTYTLSVANVTDSSVDDLAAGTGTTGTVAVNSSTMGEIETADDRDWFAVTLEADKTYRIDLEGSETAGAGTLRDPYLRGIHDTDGVLLDGTTNDDGGAGYNSRVFFTAQEAGTYYVAAGAYLFNEGTYTLSVEEVM